MSLTDPTAGAVALTVAPSVGEPTRLDLNGDTAGQLRTAIVELPADAEAVEFILQAPDEATRARVDIREGWVVALPEAVAELARTAPTWTPQDPPPPVAGNPVLCDGCTYGPATLIVPVGGDAPAERQAEWPVGLPESPAMLRGLFGLTAAPPRGSAVTVALTLVAPERTWKLVGNLEITAPAAESAEGRE